MHRKDHNKTSGQDYIQKKMAKHPDIVNEMIHQFIDKEFIDWEKVNGKLHDKLPVGTSLKDMASHHITEELKKLIGPDLEIKVLGGDNNLNLSANYKGEEFIIQIAVQRESVQHALDILNKETQCKFLATRSEFQTMTQSDYKKMNTEGSRILESMQKDSQTSVPIGVISLVEKLPSSLEKEVAHTNESPREKTVRIAASKEIDLCRMVGMQLSTIFNTLAAKDLVWTDCKPGNLLVRKTDNGESQLVIADAKAITPISELPIKKNGALLQVGLVTPEFISKKGDDALVALASPKINPEVSKAIPEKVKAIMETEYSYQMAVMLYFAATGKEVLNSDFQKNKGFDFNLPVFQTHDGQKLKNMIEKLSDPEPDKRMHYTDAARLLAVINNDHAYKTVLGKVNADTPQPANQALSTQARLSVALAGGHGKAVKELQRRNSVIDLSKKPENEAANIVNKENITLNKTENAASANPKEEESNHHRPGLK